MSQETEQNKRGGFTESEKRFLTLNPIEWTRNNYPIFVRMYNGPLPEPENRPKTKYEIIDVKTVKLDPDKK